MTEPSSKVDETGSTSDPVSTSPPTYFSYRVTIGHEFVDQVCDICKKYSDNWCFVMHNPDEDDHNPHYHFVFCDWRRPGVDHAKQVANMQKAFKDKFHGKGNAFHAGKWRDNDPYVNALQYFSHDPVGYRHFPASWADHIKAAPAWVPKNGSSSGPTNRGPRERLGDPTLTFTNVVKQALRYRELHCMDTCSLPNVVSRMVNQGCWIPSRDLLTNGIPRDLHDLFRCRVRKERWEPNWLLPHDRSSRKQEWLDLPDMSARVYADPPSAAKPLLVEK